MWAPSPALVCTQVVMTSGHCGLQGNGHARDKLHFQDADTFIVDMYNCSIWPADTQARAGIDVEGTFPSSTADADYLPLLRKSLQDAFAQFAPDLLLYNAGTDVLVHDPLGRCAPE